MTPLVFIPDLLCTAEFFAPQVAALWPHGPATVASTLAGDTIAQLATAILAQAPPQFALVGLSMGGFISLEIMRQAPGRVLRLALLGTSARPGRSKRRCFGACWPRPATARQRPYLATYSSTTACGGSARKATHAAAHKTMLLSAIAYNLKKLLKHQPKRVVGLALASQPRYGCLNALLNII